MSGTGRRPGPLYDRYLSVDWSASNSPRTGKDSIWIGEVARKGGKPARLPSRNPPTRAQAMADIAETLVKARARGERVLVGFDFVFGYPRGAAEAIAGQASWRALWRRLAEMVEDDEANRSNRFEVAAKINAMLAEGCPRYYGRPAGRTISGLSLKRPQMGGSGFAERRLAEARGRRLQPVWKLIGAGSVGSQTILGIARLEALRRDPRFKGEIAVWPFETRFERDLSRPITLVEIYPSLLPVSRKDAWPIDRAQVEASAWRFAELDGAGRLASILGAPDMLSAHERRAVLAEEGWIAGIGHEAVLLGGAPPGR